MKYLFFFMSILVLAACDPARVYEEHTVLKDRVWHEGDTLAFRFVLDSADVPSRYYLVVRNDRQYPYARLFVRHTLRDTTGRVLSEGLLSNYLFEQKTGRPLGKSALGDVYDHRVEIVNPRFPQSPGAYELQVQQFMRDTRLPGVLAIGLRVERARPPR